MEKTFTRKGTAQRFASTKRKQGFFASVREEPIKPWASTKRERAQRRYIVDYETGAGLTGSNPGQLLFRTRAAALKYAREHGAKKFSIKKLKRGK